MTRQFRWQDHQLDGDLTVFDRHPRNAGQNVEPTRSGGAQFTTASIGLNDQRLVGVAIDDDIGRIALGAWPELGSHFIPGSCERRRSPSQASDKRG
jgi:hypothetical protein